MDSLDFLLTLEKDIGREALLRTINQYVAHVEVEQTELLKRRVKDKRVTIQEELPPPLPRLRVQSPEAQAHEVAKNLAAEVASYSPVVLPPTPKQPCSYCGMKFVRSHMREVRDTIIHGGMVLADRYYCTEACELYREAILKKRMAVEKEERRLIDQIYFHKKWYGSHK